MIALDTNVLVRVLTRDDPVQAAAATALLQREDSWIAKTVLLETEWVLRYTYELDRSSVYGALLRLVGYRGVEIEDRATVLRALSWYHQGSILRMRCTSRRAEVRSALQPLIVPSFGLPEPVKVPLRWSCSPHAEVVCRLDKGATEI